MVTFLGFLAAVKPADFKQAIGLALLACSKGGPLYDPIAFLLTIAMDDAGPRPVTADYAQRLLDSAPSGMKAPATKAALLIVTDVSLRSNDGTADTDDRFMLLLVCYFLAKIGNLHSLTVLLSARKKGPAGKKDTTTPADVVNWMCSIIAKLAPGLAVSVAADLSSFDVNGIHVSVFQQHSQTTPCVPHELDATTLAADSVQLDELRLANEPFFAVLQKSVAHQVPLHVAVCGPFGVDLALFLLRNNARGYAISVDTGVNSGQPGSGVTFEAQRSMRGGLLLLTNCSIVNVGPSVTRESVTTPAILDLVATYDDKEGLVLSASNAFKVACQPLVPAVPLLADGADGPTIDRPLALSAADFSFRITGVSNPTSFLGRTVLDSLVAQSDSDAPFQLQFQYSLWLALTMVANFLLVHSAPINPTTLAHCIADPSSILPTLSALSMPPTLAAMIRNHIHGISTLAALYKFIALAMDARLDAIMQVWHDISTQPAVTDLNIPPPVVSTLPPVFDSRSGALLLSDPF
jgi:hypothetical protein